MDQCLHHFLIDFYFFKYATVQFKCVLFDVVLSCGFNTVVIIFKYLSRLLRVIQVLVLNCRHIVIEPAIMDCAETEAMLSRIKVFLLNVNFRNLKQRDDWYVPAFIQIEEAGQKIFYDALRFVLRGIASLVYQITLMLDHLLEM